VASSAAGHKCSGEAVTDLPDKENSPPFKEPAVNQRSQNPRLHPALNQTNKINSVAFSPQVNYTD
jgi:hypothetical protein